MQALSAHGRFTALHQRAHRQHAARGSVRVAAAKKKQLMMWEALREAVDEEMERDPTVCVMGELLLLLHTLGAIRLLIAAQHPSSDSLLQSHRCLYLGWAWHLHGCLVGMYPPSPSQPPLSLVGL